MNYDDPRIVQRLAEQVRRHESVVSRFAVTDGQELTQLEFEILCRVIRGESKEHGQFDIRKLPTATLGGRYRLVGHLGRGSQGITYAALDPDGGFVAVKVLDVGQVSSWKNIELFEREASALRALEHVGVPSYIDAFPIDDPPTGFCIVQEYVHGRPLSELVRMEKWDERDVRDLLLQMAEILAYIHTANPPVIHRDIKPSNLIWNEREGRLYVIDFGAARVRVGVGKTGSTVVGTHGYMPIEQYMGKTLPESDYYAMGATALYLLTGQPPSALPFERGRIRFHDVMERHSEFVPLLDRLLDPVAERRLAEPKALAEKLKMLNLDEGPQDQPRWLEVRQNQDDISYKFGNQTRVQINDRVDAFQIRTSANRRFFFYLFALALAFISQFLFLDFAIGALFVVAGVIVVLTTTLKTPLMISPKGLTIQQNGTGLTLPLADCEGAVVSSETNDIVLEFVDASHTLSLGLQDSAQTYFVCELVNKNLSKWKR